MTRASRFLARLHADARGVSALEFALIAPIMILLYCGMAELSSGIMAARKSGHATSTVGDLVAQNTQVSASDMYNLFMAANDVIVPFPAQNSGGGYILLTRATSLSVRANGSVQVDWSCTPDNPAQSSQMPPLAANTVMTGVPTNLVNTSTPGDSVIETDGQYQFAPPSNWIFPTGLKFQNTYYFKPRRSVSVAYSTTNNGSVAKCNAPS